MTLLVGSIFHMTRKIVSEMTYNVSMGTLNPTIPIPIPMSTCKLSNICIVVLPYLSVVTTRSLTGLYRLLLGITRGPAESASRVIWVLLLLLLLLLLVLLLLLNFDTSRMSLVFLGRQSKHCIHTFDNKKP